MKGKHKFVSKLKTIAGEITYMLVLLDINNYGIGKEMKETCR